MHWLCVILLLLSRANGLFCASASGSIDAVSQANSGIHFDRHSNASLNGEFSVVWGGHVSSVAPRSFVSLHSKGKELWRLASDCDVAMCGVSCTGRVIAVESARSLDATGRPTSSMTLVSIDRQGERHELERIERAWTGAADLPLSPWPVSVFVLDSSDIAAVHCQSYAAGEYRETLRFCSLSDSRVIRTVDVSSALEAQVPIAGVSKLQSVADVPALAVCAQLRYGVSQERNEPMCIMAVIDSSGSLVWKTAITREAVPEWCRPPGQERMSIECDLKALAAGVLMLTIDARCPPFLWRVMASDGEFHVEIGQTIWK